MLGEKVGEFRGKITGQRVLPPEGSSPKFETSVEIRGTILGVASTLVATYWSVLRPDGRLWREPRTGCTYDQGRRHGPFQRHGIRTVHRGWFGCQFSRCCLLGDNIPEIGPS